MKYYTKTIYEINANTCFNLIELTVSNCKSEIKTGFTFEETFKDVDSIIEMLESLSNNLKQFKKNVNIEKVQ